MNGEFSDEQGNSHTRILPLKMLCCAMLFEEEWLSVLLVAVIGCLL